MKIVVLSGSPRKGANTDTMVEVFAETAREGGNAVEVVPMRAPVCRRTTWPT